MHIRFEKQTNPPGSPIEIRGLKKPQVLVLVGLGLLALLLLSRGRTQRYWGFTLPFPFGTVDNSGASETSTYRANRHSGRVTGLGVAGTRTPLSTFPPAASPLAPVTAQAQALGYGTAPAGQQSYGTQVS